MIEFIAQTIPDPFPDTGWKDFLIGATGTFYAVFVFMLLFFYVYRFRKLLFLRDDFGPDQRGLLMEQYLGNPYEEEEEEEAEEEEEEDSASDCMFSLHRTDSCLDFICPACRKKLNQ